jgi:hypothetical protein
MLLHCISPSSLVRKSLKPDYKEFTKFQWKGFCLLIKTAD